MVSGKDRTTNIIQEPLVAHAPAMTGRFAVTTLQAVFRLMLDFLLHLISDRRRISDMYNLECDVKHHIPP